MHYLHQSEDLVNGRYRIVSLLGKGGMGETYAATDITTSQSVAIKVLSLRQLQDWKLLELFEREAQILSHLDHDSIPRYLDYFNLDTPDDRRFYLVRELIEGQSLADLIDSGWHFDEEQIRQIARQVLKTLLYLHQLRPAVIHRDIKPENLIRSTDGRIFLVDFGSIGQVYHSTVTRGSTFVGTLGYMPPEQLQSKVVPASDLYSLGATLVFLLTGRSPVELPTQRLKLDFRACVQVSEPLAYWLDNLLEPALEDRFSSAQEAWAALRDESILAPTPPPVGSKIRLERTANQLTINIPATGLNLSNLYSAFFATFWNFFVLVWTIGVLSSGAWFFALFSTPFWFTGIGLWSNILYSWFGKTQIQLNPRTFLIQWRCLGFRRQAEGSTNNLLLANVKRISENYACTLHEGVKQHRFGHKLQRVEKQWLIAEISNYLDSIKKHY